MVGANRGRETHWESLVIDNSVGLRVSTLINNLRRGPTTTPTPPKASGKNVNAENIANAIIAGFVNKPAMSNLGSPVNKPGYESAGTLYWLGKPKARVYVKDGNYYVYVKSKGGFSQSFGKWKIAPLPGTKDKFTLIWDSTLEIKTKKHAFVAGAVAGSLGFTFGRSINLSGNVANAFINGYVSTNKTPPAGNAKGLGWFRRGAGAQEGNKKELAGEVGKALGQNVAANNIAKIIVEAIQKSLKPPPPTEEEEKGGSENNKGGKGGSENNKGGKGGPSPLNKLRARLGFGASAEPPKPNIPSMNVLIAQYGPITKDSKRFWQFYNEIRNARDDILVRQLVGMFTYLNSLNRGNVNINKENANIKPKEPAKNNSKKPANKPKERTTIKTVLRKLAIRRITQIVEDPKLNPNYRYELVGNYKNKIDRLQQYRLIPDTEIRQEAEYHLKRFKQSQQTGVRRPSRSTGGFGYGGGGGYEEAIYGANRNYGRYMRSRRPSRYNNEGRGRNNNRKRLERLLREKGMSENAIRRMTEKGAGGESSEYRPSSGNNKAEYNALKKLTQPQVPAGLPGAPGAPGLPGAALPPLPGVSAKTEEGILKHLTPTQQVAVNRAGNLAAVNRILKAAGGTEKVGQAAEILKQVPKNEALKLHLVSKKAAAAVDLFGGPNKAEAAIKVNKKIVSARKKKKSTPKKKKTPVKTKVMRKRAPVSPLRTKVLKNVIAQVPKEKLIDIAGKTTLGIYKARTPKKVVVNDFARFVERKPKPQPPAKKKASVPGPQPKAKPKKIKKAKAKK